MSRIFPGASSKHELNPFSNCKAYEHSIFLHVLSSIMAGIECVQLIFGAFRLCANDVS